MHINNKILMLCIIANIVVSVEQHPQPRSGSVHVVLDLVSDVERDTIESAEFIILVHMEGGKTRINRDRATAVQVEADGEDNGSLRIQVEDNRFKYFRYDGKYIVHLISRPLTYQGNESVLYGRAEVIHRSHEKDINLNVELVLKRQVPVQVRITEDYLEEIEGLHRIYRIQYLDAVGDAGFPVTGLPIRTIQRSIDEGRPVVAQGAVLEGMRVEIIMWQVHPFFYEARQVVGPFIQQEAGDNAENIFDLSYIQPEAAPLQLVDAESNQRITILPGSQVQFAISRRDNNESPMVSGSYAGKQIVQEPNGLVLCYGSIAPDILTRVTPDLQGPLSPELWSITEIFVAHVDENEDTTYKMYELVNPLRGVDVQRHSVRGSEAAVRVKRGR